ncbi:USP domain-containing protein [Aphelenchoides fujianensis]|nr:USP domain-containing protein [Aphelenchoides fujianensis]
MTLRKESKSPVSQRAAAKEKRKGAKKAVREEETTENSAANLELGPKGLPNLGNTCFFNSTTELKLEHDCTVIICDERVELEAATVELEPARMPFVEVVRGFIREFQSGRQPNPRPGLRPNRPQQQDAHELLRYLLDGLRNEELDQFKRAIGNLIGEDATAATHKRKIQAYLRCIGVPTLDRVFGGTLLQRIECCDCGHLSTCFEPFLDLSLPISKGHSSHHSKKQGLSKSQQKRAKKTKKKNQKGKGKKRKESTCESEATAPSENGVCNGEVDEEAEEKDALADDLDELELKEKDEEAASGEEDAEPEERQKPDRDFSRVLSPTPSNAAEPTGILAALTRFTGEEVLSASNAYECEKCCAPVNKAENSKRKKTVEARKRYLVYCPPPVLTLHLKRFEQQHQFNRTYTSKVNAKVEFPLVLDLAPFCVESTRVQSGQSKVLYSLYGIVCHSGGMSSGHYIAYVRSRRCQENLDVFFRQAARLDASNFGDNHEYQRFLKLMGDSADKSPDLPLPTEQAALEYLEAIGQKSQWFYCSDSSVSTVKLTPNGSD